MASQMYKQLTTKMYKQLAEVPLSAKALIFHVTAGALIGAGVGHLLWTPKERLLDMLFERAESGGREVVTPEALLAECNDEQKKALWEALKAKHDD